MSGRKGWCNRGERPRQFVHRPPVVCYGQPPRVNREQYGSMRHMALIGNVMMDRILPKCSATTWEMLQGDLCRITLIQGSQVGDINMWNLHNPEEHFNSGKTRQLHSSHLKVFDRLWSNLPYLRPMATFIADSVNYSIDSDGAACHDVIGTRCDQYTYKLLTGKECKRPTCHSLLTEAIKSHGLNESHVHDVWNIFMCTGFTKDTQQYFTKASPAQKGDYIEFIADMDLLVALSACPQGNVSTPVSDDVPEDKCYPIGIQVFRAQTS